MAEEKKVRMKMAVAEGGGVEVDVTMVESETRRSASMTGAVEESKSATMTEEGVLMKAMKESQRSRKGQKAKEGTSTVHHHPTDRKLCTAHNEELTK